MFTYERDPAASVGPGEGRKANTIENTGAPFQCQVSARGVYTAELADGVNVKLKHTHTNTLRRVCTQLPHMSMCSCTDTYTFSCPLGPSRNLPEPLVSQSWALKGAGHVSSSGSRADPSTFHRVCSPHSKPPRLLRKGISPLPGQAHPAA